MQKILVAEDNLQVAEMYRQILGTAGFSVEVAENEKQAWQKIKQDKPDMLILDLNLKGGSDDRSGMELLKRVRQQWSKTELPALVVSQFLDTDLAIEIMQNEAEYELKPIGDFPEFLRKIKGFLSHTPVGTKGTEKPFQERIVGKSKPIMEVMKKIIHWAHEGCDLLILGEWGTGKDLLARTYHQVGPRKPKPFYEVNCPEIAKELIETELFGHEGGAYTSAPRQARKGRIEMAEGGVVFINEIGDLPLEQQKKLLRFMETKIIQPVGSTETKKLDVIIVAATNQNLSAMTDAGLFRKDLYDRMNKFVVYNPPLRERREDIPLLVEHFINKYSAKYKKRIYGVEDSVMEEFKRMRWSGNVRMLANCIEVGVLNSVDDRIALDDVRGFIEMDKAGKKEKSAGEINVNQEYKRLEKELKQQDDNIKTTYIQFHLKQNRGNVARTAKAIGVSRQSLIEIMKRLKITNR